MALKSQPRPATRDAFIGLGANLGDAAAALRSAGLALAGLPATRIVARSSVYRSAPVDASGADYLNAVVQLRTSLAPHRLLAELQRIEAWHGRERPYRNAPRTLDLDLLLYGSEQIESALLRVPHPRMHQRAFVLKPLAEIAPTLEIPGRGQVVELLAGLADQRVDRLGA